jgi:membrane-bound serine protease (ClpP class)
MGGMLGGTGLLFFLGANLDKTAFYKRVALTDTQDSSQGYVATSYQEPLKGKTGIAQTVLRPSGKVLVEGKLYDAYTRGDFIDKGQPVEVISEEGPALRVKLQA